MLLDISFELIFNLCLLKRDKRISEIFSWLTGWTRVDPLTQPATVYPRARLAHRSVTTHLFPNPFPCASPAPALAAPPARFPAKPQCWSPGDHPWPPIPIVMPLAHRLKQNGRYRPSPAYPCCARPLSGHRRRCPTSQGASPPRKAIWTKRGVAAQLTHASPATPLPRLSLLLLCLRHTVANWRWSHTVRGQAAYGHRLRLTCMVF
jgi:hypothetical protein